MWLPAANGFQNQWVHGRLSTPLPMLDLPVACIQTLSVTLPTRH